MTRNAGGVVLQDRTRNAEGVVLQDTTSGWISRHPVMDLRWHVAQNTMLPSKCKEQKFDRIYANDTSSSVKQGGRLLFTATSSCC